jgi:hypothetical protein
MGLLMTKIGLALVLLAFASVACRKTEPKQRGPWCFVDGVGSLHPEWAVIDSCTADDKACRDACNNGDGDACINRAFALQARGDSTYVETQALFERACRAGLALGCTNWGAGEWFEGTGPMRCVLRTFERACDARESMGCGMIGRVLIQSPRHLYDVALGEAELLSTCGRMRGPACRMLAYYMEKDFMGPASPKVMADLMAQACAGKDEDACGHSIPSETFHSPEGEGQGTAAGSGAGSGSGK